MALFLATILLLTTLAPGNARSQVIDFDRIDSHAVPVPERTAHRIERFLAHVFPMRQIRRYAHIPGNQHPTRLRRVTYEVIAQGGINFVLAGYSVQWYEPINELAIYRMEPDGPNQIWRSRPWDGSSGDLHFQYAAMHDRNIILFQEGGENDEFGLASLFTFRDDSTGIALHDLTPTLPWLHARAYFPFRTLYGQHISMRLENEAAPSRKNSENDNLLLTASDEQYNLGMSRLIRPNRSWKYNPTRARFEQMKEAQNLAEPEATSVR